MPIHIVTYVGNKRVPSVIATYAVDQFCYCNKIMINKTIATQVVPFESFSLTISYGVTSLYVCREWL